jgi:hypothetical protein
MEYCPNVSMVLDLLNHESEERKYVPARCKKWSCPYCCKVNSQNLGRLLSEAMDDYLSEYRENPGKMRYSCKMITLTVPGSEYRSSRSVETASEEIKIALKKLLEFLRREAGLEEYFWVCESQSGGWPHIHLVVIGRGIAGKWLMRLVNDRWSCLGMGRSEVRVVKSVGGLTNYLAKYLSKPESKSGAKSKRVWSMSKKLRSRVKEKRQMGSERYQVVGIYRRNEDGSRGALLWEAGSSDGLFEALARNNLQECLDFFEEKKNKRGEQTYFYDP